MTIQFSSQTQNQLQKIAKALQVNENIALEKAIDYFASAVSQELQLKQDLNMWDTISDEALLGFEESIS